MVRLLPTAAGLVSLAVAQQSGWQSDQVNATMCMWQQPRDTVYIDGGYLTWIPGMSDGSYGAATQDDNPLGIVYTLNFSRAFNMSQNISQVFGQNPKVVGAASNLAPNYFDGALLANHHQFFMYGGLLRQTDKYPDPDANEVMEYQQSSYGAEKKVTPGYISTDLPDGLTRYLAFGGAASAPSENKAFYFSGLHAPAWGPIYSPSFNDSLTAINVSNTLITLDMATQNEEQWSNVTLPDGILGRANPELVWVPVGAQGILVAVGGVVDPEFVSSAHISNNATGSENVSPSFMSNIDVYDIASGEWYTQPTVGGPSQLARGCAVMQPAQDYSSFNIYYYGGYDGLHHTDASDFKDDVWILSLPSFMWMKVASGRAGYGRAGHKCFMPYPDQMMVIGGYPAQPGTSTSCVNGGIVQLFNLSSSKWIDRYDPSLWSDYHVPEMIYAMIGGDEKGGATEIAPGPTGWATSGLSSVFASQYPTSKLTTYYPYAPAATSGSSLPTSSAQSGGGVPGFLPPLLGVILGLILLTSIGLGFLFWRRRKYLKKNGGMTEMTDENGHRIISWIRGQPTDTKAPTVTTSDDMPQSPDPEHAALYASPHSYQQHPRNQFIHHEMGDTQVSELMGTPLLASNPNLRQNMHKHTHFGSTGGGSSPLGNPSFAYSSIAATDHASMVSSNSAAGGAMHAGPSSRNPPPTQPLIPEHQERPDSPALPASSPYDHDRTPTAGKPLPTQSSNGAAPRDQESPRGESGVSAFSERDRAHLRNISDPATVSTMDGTLVGSPRLGPQQTPRMASPPILEEGSLSPLRSNLAAGTPVTTISPPTAGETDAEDYVGARGSSGPVSPLNPPPGPSIPRSTNSPAPSRKSIFRESMEDMGRL
ncbi:kelch repeat protein [Diaporthe helianthi]|uniref:Kelch repeat protein n=1 Tax=Diaporthe helianthi TaxID=158607 RepID=A0A2P5HVQ6_DIAHE|nr:kelch repeat protein [Diaporthe helianthi]